MSMLCVARWRVEASAEWSSGCAPRALEPGSRLHIFTAARYRQATDGRCHDDAHPDKTTLHERGWFVPTPDLWRAASVFVYFMGVRFCAGGYASIFLSGPIGFQSGDEVGPVSIG
jgi:hypothetical protein